MLLKAKIHIHTYMMAIMFKRTRAVCIYWHPLTIQHWWFSTNIIMFADGLCCLLEMFKYLFSVDFNFHAIPLILVVQFLFIMYFLFIFPCCVSANRFALIKIKFICFPAQRQLNWK